MNCILHSKLILQQGILLAEQRVDDGRVDLAVAAAQQAAALRAAESRAQAAMMVEAVEDRAYEVFACLAHSTAAHIPQCTSRGCYALPIYDTAFCHTTNWEVSACEGLIACQHASFGV